MPRKGEPGPSKYGPSRPLTAAEGDVVLANMGLAQKEAWRIARVLARVYSRSPNNDLNRQFFDELVDAAYIGLCKAAQRYDPSRGVTFATFAYPQVRGAVGAATRTAMIRLGLDSLYRKGVPVHSASSFHGDKHGDEYEDLPVWDGRSEEYDHWLTPEFLCLVSLLLPARDWEFLRLNALDGVPMRDIAAEYGVTYQRVQQVVARSAHKLRNSHAFLTALCRQMARRKAGPTPADFRGSGVATLIA